VQSHSFQDGTRHAVAFMPQFDFSSGRPGIVTRDFLGRPLSFWETSLRRYASHWSDC